MFRSVLGKAIIMFKVYSQFCDASGCESTLGQVLSRVMNTIFLDRLKADEEQLQRINDLIERSENAYGSDYLSTINKIKSKSLESQAFHPLKKIQLFSIHPSEDIGKLFLDCCRSEKKVKKYPSWNGCMPWRIKKYQKRLLYIIRPLMW